MRRYPRRKNSIKILVAVTLTAAVAFGASQYFLNGRAMGEVVAKVNGEKIYKSQIQQKLLGLLNSQNPESPLPDVENLPKEVVEILAKEIYLDNEIVKLAKKENLMKDQEIKGRIHEAKNKILRQAYVDSIVKNEITEAKISDKYVELTNELAGKKEYLVSHIVVKTKEEAEKILKDLTAKKSIRFADAAKKYSLDQESAAKGGELGYILEDNVIKEISEAMLKLKKDEISAPVQTKFGWHLVKFSASRDAKALPFESVKDNIKEQLIENRLSEINSKIMKDVKIEILTPSKPAEVKTEEAPAATTEQEAPAVYPSKEEAKAEEVKATENVESQPQVEEKSDVKSEEKSDEKPQKKSKHKKHR